MKIHTMIAVVCTCVFFPFLANAEIKFSNTIIDTTGFFEELDQFKSLPRSEQRIRAATAATILDTWMPTFKISDGKVKHGLFSALAGGIAHRLRGNYNGAQAPNVLGKALADLEKATSLDPTNHVARTAVGLIQVRTGRPREGINHLEKAIVLLNNLPPTDDVDETARREHLANKAFFNRALGYRDCGLWDEAQSSISDCRKIKNSQGLVVLQGLCLAGSGQTSQAISYAVRMPPIKFKHRTSLGSGRIPRPSNYANHWIQSQALLAAGDLEGARHVLGELEPLRSRLRMPMFQSFWQDAGMIYELLGDPEARKQYNMVALRSFLSWGYPSQDRVLSPIVLEFPAPNIPFFVTPDQGFEGGSPFAYITHQIILASKFNNTDEAEIPLQRALDLCNTLLRRNIQPDLVRAFRARVYLAADRQDLAYPDLKFAHSGFSDRGLVDPGTSIMLGQQELLAGREKRSRELFDEAIAEVPDNALAWRHLGVALGRANEFELARKAMDKALELQPDSMEGWYNLGILAYRSGDHDHSLTCLEKAWKISPGNEKVQHMLQIVATSKRQMVGN
ncbi:MAG: tetratricopeptide repeat protein [bacterium]|nr:tetratricopeptide repeat protein [bacterium]